MGVQVVLYIGLSKDSSILKFDDKRLFYNLGY
jgi:hypothetical protein